MSSFYDFDAFLLALIATVENIVAYALANLVKHVFYFCFGFYNLYNASDNKSNI